MGRSSRRIARHALYALLLLLGGLLLSWAVSVVAARLDDSAEDPWWQSRPLNRGVVLPRLTEARWEAPGEPTRVEFRPRIPPAWYRALADRLVERHAGPERWASIQDPGSARAVIHAWEGTEYRSVRWAAGEHIVYHRLGWPWRCFESWWFIDPNPSLKPMLTPALGVQLGIYEKDAYNVFAAPRLTPVVPVFPELLWSVLFYSAILAAVISGPRAARGWLRRRRGVCVRCGYNRNGIACSALCPECGHAGPAPRQGLPYRAD